jgi:hypothetical protein
LIRGKDFMQLLKLYGPTRKPEKGVPPEGNKIAAVEEHFSAHPDDHHGPGS